MPTHYTGGCQCGSVRYTLTAQPQRTVACHCKECQRQTGSAFSLSMPVPADSLQVTGETKRFTMVADSGSETTAVFCPKCGVRIYHLPRRAEGIAVLKAGTLDDTGWIRPDYFVWMKSAQSWITVPTGVTALSEQS